VTESLRQDVVIVGAGPAGLAAAVRAAEGGARVTVVDQSAHPGGQIWRHRDRATLPPAARAWIERFHASGARWMPNASVFDAAPGRLWIHSASGATAIEAGAIVLATGARELLLPFPGWTLPNVMGVGGLQALIKAGADVRGKRVVIAGSGPLVLPVAATAAQHGARLSAVCEQAPLGDVLAFAAGLWRSPAKLITAATYRARFPLARFRAGVWIERVHGDDRVRSATLTDGDASWRVPCDLVATACGLIPNVELGTWLGCEVRGGALTVNHDQQTSVPGVFAAGECAGVGGEDLAIIEGQIAGLAATGQGARAAALLGARRRGRQFARRLANAFAARPELRARPEADTVVCRCEDVRMEDLQADWGARQAKLATRAGMGACQGRVCGAAMACLFDWTAPSVRPPVTPVPVRELAHTPGAAR